MPPTTTLCGSFYGSRSECNEPALRGSIKEDSVIMLSRRRFLRHTAIGSLSAALASLAAPVSAQQLAQAQVAYQDQPNEKKRCELCIHFMKPNGCKLVTGPISPQGWCRLFSANA